jgi:hypothetical protein
MTCQQDPMLLTDEQKTHICAVLTIGCDRQTAADYVGCSLADMRHQMQNDGPFLAAVCRAEAKIELNHMRNVHTAATGEKKDWRASVWWLERRSPERYARRAAGEVTQRQLKAFVAILADALKTDVHSVEDRERIMARLQAIIVSIDQLLSDAQVTVSDSEDSVVRLAENAAECDDYGSASESRLDFDTEE